MIPPRGKYRDLAELMDYQTFLAAQKWFLDHGVTCGWSSPKRSWNFACVGRSDGPTYVILWLGIEAFVACIEDAENTLRQLYEHGAAVKGYSPQTVYQTVAP